MYWNNRNNKKRANKLYRLTLTWDVLKFVSVAMPTAFASGLTLTWDVLKYNYQGIRCFGERD